MGLEWVRAAFVELTTSRPVSLGGALPIPFVAICMYADRYEIDDFESFLALIRAMDAAYMEFAAEQKSA